MDLFGVILMAVVAIGVAVAIVLLERPRAERIRRDLAEEARQRRRR